jgi:small subunit ribosomal protein S1
LSDHFILRKIHPMADPRSPEMQPDEETVSRTNEEAESFSDILSQYEREHKRKPEAGARQIDATVITVTAEAVILDIGFKTEGALPLADLQPNESFKPGDKILVTVKGRNPEGYYDVSRFKIARPTDWTSLEKAFAEKSTIVGTVTGVVKGGVSVDVGVRAFMPASRSGTRDAAELEKMVGQEIRCRITKLDVADENVVVDRRVIADEERRASQDERFAEFKEGDTVSGEVRSLMDYGAFIDLGGGVDGLLHVGEISWGRVNKPADVLTVGQQVEARIIKIDADKRRLSLSLKALQAHPWDAIAEKYQAGQRIRGTVTRVMEFGAFVELEPGIEGLIHVSEMSWAKKVRIASDVVKPGDEVEAVVLGVNAAERRISLGLKQALGDPWGDVEKRFPAGSAVDGQVTRMTPFGAFVQLAEGVEGLVHVSEISAEKRINHPQEVLRVGQTVKAQVLALDKDKRQMRLSLKRLVPTGLDEYIAEHKEGDTVTGRVVDVSGANARVELGEGVIATCDVTSAAPKQESAAASGDLSSALAALSAKWKAGSANVARGGTATDVVSSGQVRSFRITKLEPATKRIELELV